NPDTFGHGKDGPYDCCFRVGNAAFVMPDLRSHRNVRKPEIWKDGQFSSVKAWLEKERAHVDTLFFVTPVVFAHGDPKTEAEVIRLWPRVLAVAAFTKTIPFLGRVVAPFDPSIGDIRDDLNDAWGSRPNVGRAAEVLDWLFSLQNPPADDDAKRIRVV